MSIEVHTPAEAKFLEACYHHDISHEMSDDYWNVTKRGQRELALLKTQGREMGWDRAVEIFNQVCDESFRDDAGETFHWKGAS